jgi:adenylate cyclase, class 2
MALNIEIKFRGDDLDAVAGRAIDAGAVDAGVLEQDDHYFRVVDGRLKLRSIRPADGVRHAQLITYHRADRAEPRASHYALSDIPGDIEPTRSRLRSTHGEDGRVVKRRRLLRWRNVRIHLDIVEQLGRFVELESVVDDTHPPAVAMENLTRLIGLLGLSGAEVVAVGYVDLMRMSHSQVTADG